MAARARLALPPRREQEDWPYHTAKCSSLPASALFVSERRMEAETYLSRGYGIRVAIESCGSGWVPFGKAARAWMPGRLKGIQVGSEHGTPFLAATQVYDVRPIPRKWLALARTADAQSRFVTPGTILVTCSGSVGRPTLAYAPHEDTLISHDLLRVEPIDPSQRGWTYAFLLCEQARAMNISAQYGHIIKHLEVAHLSALPMPLIDAATAEEFNNLFDQVLDLRNRSHKLAANADRLFESAVGTVKVKDKEDGFEVRGTRLQNRRRRLEAAYYHPLTAAILAKFRKFEPLKEVTTRVWWMSRFKRFYGEAGIPYTSADELFSINPEVTKRILVDPNDNHREYFVEPRWIVMACSGQVYGLNGAAALMTEHNQETFFSHDLIRIVVDQSKIRPGYLLVALTNLSCGRPLLIRAAYGTSIPHLDPADVAEFPVVRFESGLEAQIADLAEASAEARADADMVERGMADRATKIVDRFILGA